MYDALFSMTVQRILKVPPPLAYYTPVLYFNLPLTRHQKYTCEYMSVHYNCDTKVCVTTFYLLWSQIIFEVLVEHMCANNSQFKDTLKVNQ